MEISKLTICRQDLIVVSDTDTESKDVNSNKKKNRKRTKCVRDVKLTTMTVNRIVPICYRQRCQRSGQHYHRKTSRNTKYPKRETAFIDLKYDKNKVPAKSTQCKSDKSVVDLKMVLTRDPYSPITVASSDTYENISSNSFNVRSSDSDELEDLINSTRKRMKNNNENFNTLSMRKPVCATTTQDDYQNISSCDEELNSSIHSVDTVVLYHGDTNRQRSPRNHGDTNRQKGPQYHDNTKSQRSPQYHGVTNRQKSPQNHSVTNRQKSPQYGDQLHLKRNNNNNIDPMLFGKDCNQDSNELLQKKIPSLSSENSNNMSPMYEIAGKVFMEHYLNTSIM